MFNYTLKQITGFTMVVAAGGYLTFLLMMYAINTSSYM